MLTQLLPREKNNSFKLADGSKVNWYFALAHVSRCTANRTGRPSADVIYVCLKCLTDIADFKIYIKFGK